MRRVSERFISESSSSSEKESSSDQSANVSGDDDGETRMSICLHIKAHHEAVKSEHPFLKKFVHSRVEGASNIKNATDANNSATHIGRFVKFFNRKAKGTKTKQKMVKALKNKKSIMKCFANYSRIKDCLYSLKSKGRSSSTALNHLFNIKRCAF